MTTYHDPFTLEEAMREIRHLRKAVLQIDELRAALQERDAEKVDAERYRWLRKNGNRFYNSINYQGNDEILDSGIDEAMKDKS